MPQANYNCRDFSLIFPNFPNQCKIPELFHVFPVGAQPDDNVAVRMLNYEQQSAEDILAQKKNILKIYIYQL